MSSLNACGAAILEYCNVDLFDVKLEAGPLSDREGGCGNTSIHEL
jgi:hypothetical protein